MGLAALLLCAAPLSLARAADPLPDPAPPPSSGAPSSGPPSSGPAPANLHKAISRPGANDAPVEYGTLGAPDTSRIGLIGQAEGGLSPGMWEGTSGAIAAQLLATDPTPTKSLALQGLARRLLLSEARPPADGLPEGASFLTLRLRRLLTLGAFDEVLQLSNPVVPGAQADGEERVRAEAFLLKGEEPSACALAQRMRQAVTDPYWAKIGAFCDVRAGNVGAAELAVGLLKGQGYDDASFYALYDWLVIPPSNGKPAPPPKPAKGKKAKKTAKAAKPEPPRVPPKGDGSPLAFAMLRAAKLPVADGSLTLGRVAAMRALAIESAGASPEDRFNAATEAAAFGAFPLDALRDLYAGATVPPGVLADPAGAAALLPPAQGLALLYQAVGHAGSPADRVHLAGAGYQAALARGYGALFASLILPDLRQLAPDPALIADIPGLVEVLLAGGETELAYSWFGLIDARQENSADPRPLDHLSNALRIAQPSERLLWKPEIVKRQLDRAALQGSAALAQRNFEVRVLAALGYAVPPEVMAALPPVTPVIGTALPAFQDAVAGHRVAEAILRVYEVLGAEGPGGAQPASVIELVRGLFALGLEDDARAIGTEAALASIALHP